MLAFNVKFADAPTVGAIKHPTQNTTNMKFADLMELLARDVSPLSYHIFGMVNADESRSDYKLALIATDPMGQAYAVALKLGAQVVSVHFECSFDQCDEKTVSNQALALFPECNGLTCPASVHDVSWSVWQYQI